MLRLLLTFSLLLPLQAEWLTSLDEAKVVAKKESKDIYLVFLSTKTSGACVQFQKRVLSQESFQEAIDAKFVRVLLDVPALPEPDPDSPLTGNQAVAMKFAVRKFPTVFYLNSNGLVYAREIGAAATGPLKHAEAVLTQAGEEASRQEALQHAYELEGMERAKALIVILGGIPDGADSSLYAGHFKELTKVDPEDSLGFRKQRMAELGFENLERSLEEVFHKDSYNQVVELVDQYVLKFRPEGPLLQRALFRKLAALNHGKETEAAIKVAGEVIAVDANSSHGKFAAQILKRLKSK